MIDRSKESKGKRYLLLLATAVLFVSGCARAAGSLTGEEKASIQETTMSAGQETSRETEKSQETGVTAGPLLFEGQDMEGHIVSSAILSESALTMVNVWATYCNPCLREMPGLGELAGEYEKERFQIIGIISDVAEGADQKTMDMAAALIEKTGADYPHLLLNESLYRGLLDGVTAVPTTFFINGDGEILETVVGSMEKADWKEKIDGLLER